MTVENSAEDVKELVLQLVTPTKERLRGALSATALSLDEREHLMGLQGLLCGVLQVCTQKLGAHMGGHADELMTLYLQVFKANSLGAVEDAFMAIGAVADAVEGDFDKYMEEFLPFLIQGLKSWDMFSVCMATVNILQDVLRALGERCVKYSDTVMSAIMEGLQSPTTHRDLKIGYLNCFMDLAFAIEGRFIGYLPQVMEVCMMAAQSHFEDPTPEDEEWQQSARAAVLGCYSAFITGLMPSGQHGRFGDYMQHVLAFINHVAADPHRAPEVTKAAAGLIGDVASAYGGHVKHLANVQPVVQMVRQALADPSMQSSGEWAQQQLSAAQRH